MTYMSSAITITYTKGGVSRFAVTFVQVNSSAF